MPSVNLRQLRDTRQIKTWLKAGETIIVRERNEVLGKIVPEVAEAPEPDYWPDILARHKEIFGDKILPGADMLIEERENSPW